MSGSERYNTAELKWHNWTLSKPWKRHYQSISSLNISAFLKFFEDSWLWYTINGEKYLFIFLNDFNCPLRFHLFLRLGVIPITTTTKILTKMVILVKIASIFVQFPVILKIVTEAQNFRRHSWLYASAG